MVVSAKGLHSVPDAAEWITERRTERRNGSSWDVTKGETLKLAAIGYKQAKVFGRERERCLGGGFDIFSILAHVHIQSNLVHEHVRVENNSSLNLKTFPDHPSKGNAGETATFVILHRSTPDI